MSNFLRFLGINKQNGNSAASPPPASPPTASLPAPLADALNDLLSTMSRGENMQGCSTEDSYKTLLKMNKAAIKFDRDSGLDAATRDLLNARAMASRDNQLSDVLGELIGLLFADLKSYVEEHGWTSKSVSRYQHLQYRCEMLPLLSEQEQLLDLLDEYQQANVGETQ